MHDLLPHRAGEVVVLAGLVSAGFGHVVIVSMAWETNGVV